MTSDPTPMPVPLRLAAWLLRAESVGLAGVSAYLVYQDTTGTARDLVSALWVTGFAVGGAVVLWLLANALVALRAGARAPSIVLQLMLLPVGYYMLQGGMGWLGVPLALLGLLVVGLLVAPATNRALGFD